jgi:hypothetical protein
MMPSPFELLPFISSIIVFFSQSIATTTPHTKTVEDGEISTADTDT